MLISWGKPSDGRFQFAVAILVYKSINTLIISTL